jgi:phosphoglycolate phosphatase-like HAD superfamily hydrolase
MNLVMLDIDGTLTQSYEYDQEIFGLAIGEVLGCPPVNADLTGYINKTSTGVTEEAIRRVSGTEPKAEQIEDVKINVLGRLENMHKQVPKIFAEVPGAAYLLERLRANDSLGIAIATGCWQSEALFKLQTSGISATGIPMATSDDDTNRTRIMQIAVERARNFYACPGFERVVYLGDGPWDMQEARTLGFGFIGIGPRIQALMNHEAGQWYPDFLDTEAVLASISAAWMPPRVR